MNTELKAMIDVLVDAEGAVVDAAGKASFATVTMPQLMKVGMDLPAAIGNFSDLQQEIKDLSIPANQQDLEAYVIGKVAGGSAKAQAIIAASVALINGGVEMFNAIKM